MQIVTIDYRRVHPAAAWQSLQHSWVKQWFGHLIVSGVLQLSLLPFVVFLVWEQRWISLAVFEVGLLYWARTLNRNVNRQTAERLRRMPTSVLTITPQGIDDVSEHVAHGLTGWRMFRQLRRTSEALMPLYFDHGKNLGYVIPRACFPSPAAAEDFATAAEQAIAAQATAPSISTAAFEQPHESRYHLAYQLTNRELDAEAAKLELYKLHPEVQPGAAQTPAPKQSNWKFYTVLGLFFVLYRFEGDVIPVYHQDYSLLLLLSGFFYAKVFASLAAFVARGWRSLKKPVAPQVEVWLNDNGIVRHAPEERLYFPWSGISAITQHEERLLLWHQDSCRLIVPLRVFDSPEQVHECERWIQTMLQKQFTRLAVAELAEPEPAITVVDLRPASNNPYQSPQM